MIWVYFLALFGAIGLAAFYIWNWRVMHMAEVQARKIEAQARIAEAGPSIVSQIQRANDVLEDACRMHDRSIALLERIEGPQKRTGAEVLSFQRPDDKPPQGAA